MRINLLRRIVGAAGNFDPGEVDISDDMAAALIAGGYALALPVETTALVAPETAVLDPAPLRRPGRRKG